MRTPIYFLSKVRVKKEKVLYRDLRWKKVIKEDKLSSGDFFTKRNSSKPNIQEIVV